MLNLAHNLTLAACCALTETFFGQEEQEAELVESNDNVDASTLEAYQTALQTIKRSNSCSKKVLGAIIEEPSQDYS